jgi:osmotically-inducible protein OsmY
MAIRLFRRRQRPIDRVRHTARRSARTARDTARRSALTARDTARDSARRSALTARDTARRSAQWAGERMRDAQEEVAGRVLARRARVERRKRLLWLAAGGAVGAALTALLDPVRGKARRARIRDQGAAFLRRRGRTVGRLGRKVGSDLQGFRDRQAYGRSGEYVAPNDETLQQKVESEVLGRADVPKGSIVLNAEDGVIVLRGELDTQDQIDHVESLVRKVDGVLDVENLLHIKGSPPPNKADVWPTQ